MSHHPSESEPADPVEHVIVAMPRDIGLGLLAAGPPQVIGPFPCGHAAHDHLMRYNLVSADNSPLGYVVPLSRPMSDTPVPARGDVT
jgi:hypothetical protein